MPWCCPACTLPLSAADLLLVANQGRCPECGRTFPLPAPMPEPMVPPRPPAAELPDGVMVIDDGTSLRIRYSTRRWRSYLPPLGITLLSGLFAILAICISIRYRGHGLEVGDWTTVAMAAVGAVMAAGMAYLSIAIIANTVQVGLDPASMTWRIGPIPCARTLHLERERVQVLKLARVRSGLPFGWLHAYMLLAEVDGERQIVLTQLFFHDRGAARHVARLLASAWDMPLFEE